MNAGSSRLRGEGLEVVRTPAWPTSHYHHIFVGVHVRRAGDLFSLPVSLFSADARRAIRFWLSTVYSIAVPHVSEIARQCMSLLVSGVRARLSGVRRIRVVSVPPFLLKLQSETFSSDRSIEIQNKMTRAVLSRALGGLV